MRKRGGKKKRAREEPVGDKASSLLNWGQVIVQVIVLGGFMFLIQQIYVSSGRHETIKYTYQKVENLQGGQLGKITLYKIGGELKRNIKLEFHVDERENYTILNSSVRKCQLSCLSLLFPSKRKCEDITNARPVTPENRAEEASKRTFTFPEFPANSLYELDFLIASKSGKSIIDKRFFSVTDFTTLEGEDITTASSELDLQDYLTVCRNELFFIGLLVLFGTVVVVHKLKRGS